MFDPTRVCSESHATSAGFQFSRLRVLMSLIGSVDRWPRWSIMVMAVTKTDDVATKLLYFVCAMSRDLVDSC